MPPNPTTKAVRILNPISAPDNLINMFTWIYLDWISLIPFCFHTTQTSVSELAQLKSDFSKRFKICFHLK